jgi:hypothetical protein
LLEWELGYVFSFAWFSIGDSNLSCRCSQNGKACLAPILLADVVSFGSRVVRYHDGLLVVDVLMYAVVFVGAKLTCLFKIPHKPPAGSLKVLHAPARRGGIRRAPQTKIYILETRE